MIYYSAMQNRATIKSIKQNLRKRLEEIGIDQTEARAETDLIIGHVTELTSAQQALQADSPLSLAAVEAIERIMERRILREPIQYCLGHAWFMGLKFSVCPGVFIPRSDTETLVQVVLDLLGTELSCHDGDLRILEIGVGSGAIAVTLLSRLSRARVTAYDVSKRSIEITQENARAHGVSERLSLINDDWLNVSGQSFNVIVSNPPYIPPSKNSELAPEVAHHEPTLALFGTDEDGLGHYRSMAERMRDVLIKPALIAVEVGDNQSQSVKEIFSRSGWSKPAIHHDLSGLPRVVSARA